ncbi:MAG: ADP-ribosylglycohydrolase family protein, partial [Halobacteriales archaeon]|nr:ADP-ribosylglycohydrolase family protein [Halobacteriales archaeon]
HTHPVGIEGAVAQAVAAHHALKETFELGPVLSDLDRLLESDRFRRELEAFEECVSRRDDVAAVRQLGNGVSADRSVLTAVYCFVTGDDFENTVRRAIRMGGDTDTIAAMAGALAGARYGVTDVPETWVEVEGRDRLLALADRFVSRLSDR